MTTTSNIAAKAIANATREGSPAARIVTGAAKSTAQLLEEERAALAEAAETAGLHAAGIRALAQVDTVDVATGEVAGTIGPRAHVSPAPSRAEELPTQVMLQGFHWRSNELPWWRIVEAKAPDIQDGGFSMVWLPPSQDGMGHGYLPRELYVQDSEYGTEAELRGALDSLRTRGVMPVADLVINHRIGTTGWADFTRPAWGRDAIVANDESGLGLGNLSTGDTFEAARDIDHLNPYVQESLSGWMKWLLDNVGYEGFRFDYARGYAPELVAKYIDEAKPKFAVSELFLDLDLANPSAHRQQVADWIERTKDRSSAFDFTTKGVLQQALEHNQYWRLKDAEGRPAGLMGIKPEQAVTFLDNHDTGPSFPDGGQNLWPFPPHKVAQGYAYLLTHPGTPSVYWPHFFDWGQHQQQQIKQLVQLRTQMGITAGSKVRIAVADHSNYGAFIDDKVAVRLGHGDWHPGTGWHPAVSGPDFAVYTRAPRD